MKIKHLICYPTILINPQQPLCVNVEMPWMEDDKGDSDEGEIIQYENKEPLGSKMSVGALLSPFCPFEDTTVTPGGGSWNTAI